MQRTVHEYLKALEAGDADKAASLFIPDGWVESPFLGRLPVRQFIKKVAESSKGTRLTVHDVLVSAEGHLRAVAYYLYDWRLKDGSRVARTAPGTPLPPRGCRPRSSHSNRARAGPRPEHRPPASPPPGARRRGEQVPLSRCAATASAARRAHRHSKSPSMSLPV